MDTEAELDLVFPAVQHTHREAATEAVKSILSGTTTVLVCGSREAGKSTFAHMLLKEALLQNPHWNCSLIDLDPAHSSLAPPAVVAAAPASLTTFGSDTAPQLKFGARTCHFIGDCSATGYGPELLTAAGRLAALQASNQLTVIDFPTVLTGIGTRLLSNCIDLLRPGHVVIFSRAGEWDRLASPLRKRQDIKAHVLDPASEITPRPAEFRNKRLALRFGAALENSERFSFEMSRTALVNTWLGTGSRLAPHLYKYLSDSLREFFRLFYAEMSGPHLGIVISARSQEAELALSLAMEQLGAKTVSITTIAEIKHHLVGLHTETGKFMGLGRVESIDFAREIVVVSTPVKAAAATRALCFGGRCLSDSGETTARTAPGQL